MIYRTTWAVLALAFAAIVIWQVMESRGLRERTVLLEQEVARQREQLDEALSQANNAGISAAVSLIDSTGFHDMELALERGEPDPRYPEATGRAVTVANAIAWPERLHGPVRSFVEAARSLQDALERDDLAAAREAVADTHDRQHRLSHEAYAMLQAAGKATEGETRVSTSDSAAAGHGTVHESGPQNPESDGDVVLEIGESGGPVGGAPTFRTDRGERFDLRISSAAAGVLHLHGYSLEWELEPGTQQVVSVESDIVGRFPFELHPVGGEPGVTVGYLEVRP